MAKAKTDSAEKRKVGRPRKVIDEKLLYDLAKIQCTPAEMSAILGVHVDTLRDNYSNIIAKGKEDGKASLRRMQYVTAMKGNVTMLIWLGKQLLGQKEPEREISKDAVEDVRKIIGDVVKEMKEGI